MPTKRSKKSGSRAGGAKAPGSPRARSADTKTDLKRGATSTARAGRSLLLRDVEPDVLRVLEARAKRSGRSLQQELHVALRRDARRNFGEARAIVDDWHARLAGRGRFDSAGLIREDRQR